MKIIIVSQNMASLALWQEALAGVPDVEYSSQVSPYSSADAIVVSGVFAFDRYGGRPRNDAAQILVNSRGDGLPDLVIVPPSRPHMLNAEGKPVVHPEFETISPAFYAIFHCMRAIASWNESENDPICSLILDLALLGMDSPTDRSTPLSVARALT